MCLVEVEKAAEVANSVHAGGDGRHDRSNGYGAKCGRRANTCWNSADKSSAGLPVVRQGGECEIADMVFRYGADSSRFVEERFTGRREMVGTGYYDAPRCILCFRCVRVCDEGMDVKALGVGCAARTA